MESEADIAAIARVLANRARAEMLNLMLDGRSHPAGDLAREAGIALSTASGHLGALVEAGLVRVQRSGRQRRYELSDAHVARALEALAAVAPRRATRSLKAGAEAQRLRAGRTCYDHLAGQLGVAVTDGLISRRALRRGNGGFAITPAGAELFEGLGVDLALARSRKREFALACMDWTERRFHLGGALGAALCDQLFAVEWVRRVGNGRAAGATRAGASALRSVLGIDVPAGSVLQRS